MTTEVTIIRHLANVRPLGPLSVRHATETSIFLVYRRISMRSALVVVLALSTLTAFAAPSDDYSIGVHVKKSYLANYGGQLYQELDAVVDGHDYELAGPFVSSSVFNAAILLPGDYEAKIVKDDHKVSYKMLLIYELKFPDGKTDRFTVVGLHE